VISARLDYLPAKDSAAVLADKRKVYVSRYALGRDYYRCCATGCNPRRAHRCRSW
jgi:epoxyqueuosine reductase QueG